MGVPGWLLRIVVGFLSDREMILRFKGKCLGRKQLPGGGPQGTRLGLFLFLILINAAGYLNLERNIGGKITGKLSKRSPLERIHMKYVDDMSIAQAVNLPDCLIPNPNPDPPRPFEHHNQTNHILPNENYGMQEQLENLVEYCNINEMRINDSKSKVMIFNTRRIYDERPRLALDGGDHLEVVETCKLLGVILRSDLKWWDNTDYICKKGYARLWMLRRLRILGANQGEMLDVYYKQVRYILEMAVPVWQAGLTQLEIKQIERVQRTALHIILGENYLYYENALDVLKCKTLSEMRYSLCEHFVRKASKHPRFKNWFCENLEPAPIVGTRNSKYKPILRYIPVKTRTGRFEDSPLPYLTNILNTLKIQDSVQMTKL